MNKLQSEYFFLSLFSFKVSIFEMVKLYLKNKDFSKVEQVIYMTRHAAVCSLVRHQMTLHRNNPRQARPRTRTARDVSTST